MVDDFVLAVELDPVGILDGQIFYDPFAVFLEQGERLLEVRLPFSICLGAVLH